eukprot:12579775-Ditylum_brightwellii.AAC.1
MKSITGKVKEASSKYELAISTAERNDFIHEHAIANKQADEFFLQNGLKRLEIAKDITNGLADVHEINVDGISGNGNTNPANAVAVGKTLKLNDFNIGISQETL